MSASARIAIVILVLLLLPVVFGPIVIGLLLDRGAEKVLEASARSGVQIEFERGLYTSRARTFVSIEDADGQGGELVAEHVIVHGPIPLAAPAIGRSPFDLVIVLVQSRVEADPKTLPSVAEALDGAALASIDTRVTSVGNVDAEIDSPAFELESGRLQWDGLTGVVTLRESARLLAGEFAAEGLRIADEDLSLTLQPTTTSFTADLLERRLEATLEQSGSEWTFGASRFASGKVRIEADQPIGTDVLAESRSVWQVSSLSGSGGPGAGDFEVTDLEVEQMVAREADSGLHRAEVGLRFESWRIGDSPIDGPGGLRVHLDRIDRAAIERFRTAMQALEDSGQSPEQIEAMRPFMVMEQIPALLASSPAFDVRDAFVESPDGRLEASMHLTVDGSQPELLADPFMLMGLIEANAAVEGPEPLVRRLAARLLPPVQTAPPVVGVPPGGPIVSDPIGAASDDIDEAAAVPIDRIDAWLEQGTLVREGDRLHFDARFENGLPMLNGQPADPSIITNLMPGM